MTWLLCGLDVGPDRAPRADHAHHAFTSLEGSRHASAWAAEGTRTRDARRPAPLDTQVAAIRRRSQEMSDVTTRLEQVSRHLERAQRVLDDVNRVVHVADDVHTAVDQARHT